MSQSSGTGAAHGPVAIDELIALEITRTQAPPGDVDRAIRFLASARGRDPKAYQALPRRMRRLVDLLIAA
ncbi:hypothetical protein [Beijerinckia sp. L45]|uniref:hypothetical protein n=1 Tax=Beijerinckia sp. L45 TaxID=1641855 RepID=UPI00131C8FE0|nr:hypothetical protein [Beijerinckia sp. L45]